MTELVIAPIPVGSHGVTMPIGDTTMQAAAAPSELDRLMSLLRKFLTLAPDCLSDGYSLWFGWVPVVVHTLEAGGFELIVPDVLALDGSWTRDLTLPLRVLATQSVVLADVGQESHAAAPGFLDKVVVERGAESASSVYVERTAVTREGDSGWYLGIADPDNERGELFSCRVADLLRLRPAILPLLPLPDGTIAFLQDDELISIADGENRELWPKKRAP